jgi:5-carboxymethyl-2-hydroxymuconate isomerase
MQGRTQEQKKNLSERVVRALNALLPDVEIISVNVRDFEKATY